MHAESRRPQLTQPQPRAARSNSDESNELLRVAADNSLNLRPFATSPSWPPPTRRRLPPDLPHRSPGHRAGREDRPPPRGVRTVQPSSKRLGSRHHHPMIKPSNRLHSGYDRTPCTTLGISPPKIILSAAAVHARVVGAATRSRYWEALETASLELGRRHQRNSCPPPSSARRSRASPIG